MARKVTLLVALTLLILASASPRARAGEQDFQLFNRTGVDIHKLYIAPHSSDDWQEDVLGEDMMLNGSDIMIKFHPSTTAKMWDIRIEDRAGNYAEWENIDLTEASQVILEANGVARIK